jgi:hypothetical protein
MMNDAMWNIREDLNRIEEMDTELYAEIVEEHDLTGPLADDNHSFWTSNKARALANDLYMMLVVET